MTNQNRGRTDGPGFALVVEILYLILLFAIALFYLTDLNKLLPFAFPNAFGPIAAGVPWFGALGAVVISLSGIVDHRNDWDPSYKYWHFTRPLVGAALGVVAVLIFQAGILAVASTPSPPKGVTAPPNLLYYLIAFLVGYREETFRELIKRLADVVLTPGGGPKPPVVSSISPDTGAVTGGDTVTISGSGFSGATAVKFGSAVAHGMHVDSDSQITATTPPGTGTVGVTVTTKAGSMTGGQFRYS
jgi:hypothetical protein